MNSLPLDARRRLGADVVEHAVHAFDAVEDLVGGVAEHFIGQPDPFGGHGVFADDGTEADGLLVAAFVAFDADGFDGEQGGVGLPSLLIPAAAAEFADEDGIGLLSDGDAFRRDFARNAHGEAGAGEWMTPQSAVRDAEAGTEGADFVFEEFGERFEHFALLFEFHDAIDAVVVRLDLAGDAAAGGAFDDVGIQSALREQFDVVGNLPEFFHEERADDAALLLGVGDAFEGSEEDDAGVDLLDGHADFFEESFHLGGFVQAHEAGVDVDAAHLHARTSEQHSEHGAVHAAGDAADDFAIADFGFDALDHLRFEFLDVELGELGTAFDEEVLQDGRAFMRMRDLRVKLDAPAAVGPFESDGNGVFVGGDDFCGVGKVGAGVAVAHPNLGFVGDAVKEVAVIGDDEFGGAILASDAGLHRAAMLDVEELHAVAHAEHRDAEGHEFVVIDIRRVFLRGAARAAGKDDGTRVGELRQLRRRIEVRDEAQLAHAADDELGILGAVIEDGDFLGGHEREMTNDEFRITNGESINAARSSRVLR